MNRIIVATLAACLTLAVSAAYACDETTSTADAKSGPVTVSPTVSAGSSAAGGKVSDSGNSSSYSAGGNASLRNSGNSTALAAGGQGGNGGGAQVQTVDNSKLYSNWLPPQAGAAEVHPAVGLGVMVLSGNDCGPLQDLKEEVTEYGYKPLFGKLKKFTLNGQYTVRPVPHTEIVKEDGHVVMESVVGPDGKVMTRPLREVVPFYERKNPDGSITLIGTVIRQKGRIVISNGMSTSFGIGGAGGASMGSASLGNSSNTTGTQEDVTLGYCEFGTKPAEKTVGETPPAPDSPPDGKPTYKQLEQKNQQLDEQLKRLTPQAGDK